MVGLIDSENGLNALGDPANAMHHQRFFKTGPGQYGHGDTFIGIVVPELRKLSKKYRHLSLSDLETLIQSPIHEKRLLALFILVFTPQKTKNRPSISI